MSPVPLVREHGTPKGYGQHYRAGEEQCGECQPAGAAYQRDRAARVRAEQEERRERRRRQEAGEAP